MEDAKKMMLECKVLEMKNEMANAVSLTDYDFYYELHDLAKKQLAKFKTKEG